MLFIVITETSAKLAETSAKLAETSAETSASWSGFLYTAKSLLLETLILRVFRGLGLKIWVTEMAQISFLLTLLMGSGLINVFQDLPTIKVQLLT